MTEPSSDSDPVPVLPLEYEPPASNAWVTVVTIVCAMGAIFTSISLVLDCVTLLAMYWDGFGGRSTSIWSSAFPLFSVPLILVRGLLLVGCIRSLRFRAAGWQLVIWCSAGMVIGGLVVEMITVLPYVLDFQRFSFSNVMSPGMAIRYITANLANYVRGCFVPATLWYFFLRTEVRGLFRR